MRRGPPGTTAAINPKESRSYAMIHPLGTKKSPEVVNCSNYQHVVPFMAQGSSYGIRQARRRTLTGCNVAY
ncbi:Hypothetical protein NTJ_02137 [Nesidiocoris tenuis]|uniref:Uncharacterized protein n=1 Tax=Nesidiocoris tenuis TaxID=355587 RepID=A0ABN7AAP1_9HEMI|nr:Hypothetical protein NTJ_02137 [Nesidiocoris tenuis]